VQATKTGHQTKMLDWDGMSAYNSRSRQTGGRKRNAMVDPELETFKRMNPLSYFASQGYVLDRKESSRGSAVMRNPADDDKIIITREAADGHYVYYSVRDDSDNGTIIDFIQKRRRLSLGALRMELRPWIGRSAAEFAPYPPLSATPKDRVRVELEFAKMQDAHRHPYLEQERGIPADLLQQERFAGTIKIDRRQNAVFRHEDARGLCGYEIKNRGFTGFASGGTKGLWSSREQPDDNRLVFCESTIDALSHALLFPDGRTRYASVGGKLNPSQPELIRAAIARMPSGSEIVAAMDADQAGRELAQVIAQAVKLSGRDDVRFRIQEPEGEKDWNDVLRAKRRVSPASWRSSEARPA
jgi:hypothetical protein